MVTMTQPQKQGGKKKKRFIPKIDAGKDLKLSLGIKKSQYRLPERSIQF